MIADMYYRLKMKDNSVINLDNEVFLDFLRRRNFRVSVGIVYRSKLFTQCLKTLGIQGTVVDWSMENYGYGDAVRPHPEVITFPKKVSI